MIMLFIKSIKNKLLVAFMILSVMVLFGCGDGGENDQVSTVEMDQPVIADSSITSAINDELIMARGVSAGAINVTTVDGIATLSGTVDNILAKERANRIASMVKGVRSVVNNIDVALSTRTDSEIQQDIEYALLNDPATDSWQIGVDVNAGDVTLTGNVDSWAEKELAASVAKNISGVTDLNNNITIDFDATQADADIKDAIEQRLKWDIRLDDGLVNVTVNNGIAELSGTVGSAYEKALASNTALLAGARQVESDALEIKWWARDEMLQKQAATALSDMEIEDAVEDAFLYDPRVNSFNIDAEVNNGIATLRGVVDNLKAKRAAARDAENTMGVWQVENEITVDFANMPTDAAITQDVSKRLLFDPYVERYEINVSTENGVVTLNGEVDTYFEKWQAEDVAARTPGVSVVANELKVDYEAPDVAFYDWDPLVDDYDILVEDRVATLTGLVDSWYEKREATEEAYEGGALYVNNELNVKGYEQKQFGQKQ